ncbi:hypothetical protein QTH90_31475 [Variovorax sp. J2P1-59]|uniref:hypothetical protein n=1 Tax=Variovorax flavidus TaxID=3053501 RepID=UPI002577567C|nr:hypothetical protein [Variovorax sp. J2P1-59]MDM0078957.1 hypothetical protein [Variovorax sp. J2P1-59]
MSPGSLLPPAEDQFLRDATGVTRTKLAQDGAFSDFFEDEIEAIFRDAPVPRMGVATRARDSGSFVALDAAAQGCAPLGSRYCIVLIAVRRREYRQSEGKRLLQVVRDLAPEAFFAFGICPDDSLPHDTVRVSILTA